MKPDCIDHGKNVSLSPEGYALVGWPGRRSRCTRLHRLIFAKKEGKTLEDITGIVVRHTCDNPRCINEAHLIAGTKADNNKDRAERKRSARTVPSKWKVDLPTAQRIVARYNPKRDPINGVTAIARDYGVDRATILSIVRKEHSVWHA